MRARLRSIHSPDVPDLATYTPASPDRFRVFVQLMVGPEGEDGHESFDVIITTPLALAEEMAHERTTRAGAPIRVGRGLLLVDRFDFDAIYSFVEHEIAKCEGPSWNDVALQVARLGIWEFEDYVEADER